MLKLKIITPRKVVLEEEVASVSAPTIDGEITVLTHHINLFTRLTEGVVRIKTEKKEDYLAVGGGYLQTNGENVNLLVSRAYHQSEIDERLTNQAIEDAKKILRESKDEVQRAEAMTAIRRSIVDMKLIKRRKRSVANI